MTPSTRQLVQLVADVYEVDPDLIVNGCKFPPVVSARHACWIIYADRTRNMSRTAREFRVDHGSIIHARRRMAQMCELDPREAGLWSEARYRAAQNQRKRGVDMDALGLALANVERGLGEVKRLLNGGGE